MQNQNEKVDDYLAKQEEWKREKLEALRGLIHELQPNVVEEWKWNVPVFTVGGKMKVAMSAFKDHVKYNFFVKGVKFDDANKLFNNGFDSQSFRSIDLKKDENVDRGQLSDLLSQFLG